MNRRSSINIRLKFSLTQFHKIQSTCYFVCFFLYVLFNFFLFARDYGVVGNLRWFQKHTIFIQFWPNNAELTVSSKSSTQLNALITVKCFDFFLSIWLLTFKAPFTFTIWLFSSWMFCPSGLSSYFSFSLALCFRLRFHVQLREMLTWRLWPHNILLTQIMESDLLPPNRFHSFFLFLFISTENSFARVLLTMVSTFLFYFLSFFLLYGMFYLNLFQTWGRGEKVKK